MEDIATPHYTQYHSINEVTKTVEIMEKYLFDEDQYGNCLQRCNVLNNGTMIGSVKCQECKYCISVSPHCEFTGSAGIVCYKIDEAIKQTESE